MLRKSLAFALLLAIAPVAGCASQSAVAVDEEAYRSAFDAFAECMDSAGYPVKVVDDSGTVIDYAIPSTVIGTSTEEECYGTFRSIDMEWQVRHEDSSKGAIAVRECLVAHGIEPVGTAAGDWELVLENELEHECP